VVGIGWQAGIAMEGRRHAWASKSYALIVSVTF
jgi:hypothetical protein